MGRCMARARCQVLASLLVAWSDQRHKLPRRLRAKGHSKFPTALCLFQDLSSHDNEPTSQGCKESPV